MALKNVKFVLSAPNKKSWPTDEKKEIVMLGRSNVGKSTFINTLCNNKSMAKVSSTPGRTRMLNFFDVDDRYRIVDAPGYGYATSSIGMDSAFMNMMEEYLFDRKNLAGAFLLIDSRHVPTNDDILMFNTLVTNKIPFIIIATKCDKLNQSGKAKLKKNFKVAFNVLEDLHVIPTDNVKKLWVDGVVEQIEELINM